MAEEVTAFGPLLRACRVAAGLSQEDLVRRSGLDVRTIRNLERGRARWPYPDTVRRLADALDLSGADRDAFTAAAGRRLASGTGEAGNGAAGEPGPAGLPADESGRVVPREVPGRVRAFTGRTQEMAALSGLLEQADPGTVVISAIGGTAGVGKTALAVQWAHQVADRFPDGLLYANLRGYDPGQPLPPADALAGFLRSLGVPGQDIPPGADQRAARYRSLLAGKQMLIMLDNARSAEQVRPLLPGTGSCITLVTSRDVLSGLVAADGAIRLDLDLLPPRDAVALLRTLIGPRVDAEPAAAAELAELCCRLPLALRVAAELAALRPDAPLAQLAGELADLRTRLDRLEATGDLRTQVRTVFSWSCRQLDAETARTFRLLGLHPGPDLDTWAAAALTSATVPQASRALDILARAHLIQIVSPGRYGLHDLLRGYAAEQALLEETEDARHDAVGGLLDYYLATAAVAMNTVFPSTQGQRPRVLPPAELDEKLVTLPGARDWLEAERVTLVAVAATAADHWPEHATRLAGTLAVYFDAGGHHADALAVYAGALRAARRAGDQGAVAASLHALGEAYWRQSWYDEAVDHFKQALDRYQLIDDQRGQARSLNALGSVMFNLGRYQDSMEYRRRALSIFRALGDRLGEARMLSNLGIVLSRLGDYRQAASYQHQALALFRAGNDATAEAGTLTNIGVLLYRQGRWEEAASHQRSATVIFRQLGHRVGEAAALDSLGLALRGLGDWQQAADQHQHALRLYREAGNRGGEAEALNGLGEAVGLVGGGDIDQSRSLHRQAFALASEIGNRAEQARSHEALAQACGEAGETACVRWHLQNALDIFADLAVPDADRVRAKLQRPDPALLGTPASVDGGNHQAGGCMGQGSGVV